MMNLIRETALLRDDLGRLPPPEGVTVHHPLRDTWALHRHYLMHYATDHEDMLHRRIVLVGMAGVEMARVEDTGGYLWRGAASLWGSLDKMLGDMFVMSYCPLVYFDKHGNSVLPGALSDDSYKAKLHALCGPYLLAAVAAFRPEIVVTVGAWVDGRVQIALANTPNRPRTVKISQPTNKGDWLAEMRATLNEAGLLLRSEMT